MFDSFKKNYIVLIILPTVLFITRIISFRESLLNIDELEWLYLTRKCLTDPRPFVGFDAHTSGPFSIYFLVLFKTLTGISKLYQLRLISFFFFILPSFFLVYQICQKSAKKIGVLTITLLLCSKSSHFTGYWYEDISSYNTEYQILFLTSLLFWIFRNKNGLWYYLIYSLILFLLPFVKFQAIPLLLFWGGYIILKLMKERKYKMIIGLITFYLLLNLSWLFFMYTKGVLPEFYNAYILKNLNYMSNSALGADKINPINFIFIIYEYYQFTYIFIFIFLYFTFLHNKQIFRSNFFDLIFNPIVQSFSFFLCTSTLIIISKNNFSHYYILLFLPTSIFVSDLYDYLSHLQCFKNVNYLKTIYPIFAIILITNFNFDFFTKSIGLVFYKINNNSVNKYPFGVQIRQLADENLTNWLHKNKGNNESLLVLGWFEAQAIYYVLQNDFRLQSRSSHSFYLQDSFRSKNKEFFAKEEQNYLDDMKVEKPKFIVDTWNLLSELKGTKITQFVSKNYSLKVSTKKYQIYERLD